MKIRCGHAQSELKELRGRSTLVCRLFGNGFTAQPKLLACWSPVTSPRIYEFGSPGFTKRSLPKSLSQNRFRYMTAERAEEIAQDIRALAAEVARRDEKESE